MKSASPGLWLALALCGCVATLDTARPNAGGDAGHDNGGRGGGPGNPDGAGSPFPEITLSKAPPVRISEIMYHPVLEDAAEDNHEFLEIYNHSDVVVALDGWTIAGTVRYAFPAGSTIRPGQYILLAKNPAKLVEVAGYKLNPDQIFGRYERSLDNGGGQVALLDEVGALVDGVAYDDAFPWPVAADALGAGKDWLPADKQPREKYMGVSLERIRFDVPALEVANWAPSPLDGATPGRQNSVRGNPAPVVEAQSALPQQGTGLIRAADDVVLRARFSTLGKIANVDIEYFVDDPEKSDDIEVKSIVPMVARADGHAVTLPRQKDNSIVRYRFFADRGAGREQVSPRPSDPYAWHAYFVSPVIASASPVYHLFISSGNWGKMWTDAGGESPPKVRLARTDADGCTLRPEWWHRHPATMVVDGKVYDVRVRYQGSRSNRLIGEVLANWPHKGPSAGPNPPRMLSWGINFPRYDLFAGKREDMLLKEAVYWSCSGLAYFVDNKLMESVGVPAARVKFVRTYVNGGYYTYSYDTEPINEIVAKRAEPADSDEVGDLFKADGGSDDGPWAVADERPIGPNPKCPRYTMDERWSHTYERQTHSWKGRLPTEVIQLINDLDKARAAGIPAMRTFLAEKFDLPLVANQIAVRNWSGPFDDAHHNHNLYRRASDEKWMIIPWDAESQYGALPTFSLVQTGVLKPSMSFFVGQEGDRSNRPITPTEFFWNRIKDAYFRSYKTEYEKLLRDLSKTKLSPSTVSAIVDAGMDELKLADWNEIKFVPDPARRMCDPATYPDRIKTWARERNLELARQIPP